MPKVETRERIMRAQPTQYKVRVGAKRGDALPVWVQTPPHDPVRLSVDGAKDLLVAIAASIAHVVKEGEDE